MNSLSDDERLARGDYYTLTIERRQIEEEIQKVCNYIRDKRIPDIVRFMRPINVDNGKADINYCVEQLSKVGMMYDQLHDIGLMMNDLKPKAKL